MVVVTVQVTAVVLQLLSFSKAVVLGGCECTGDNCWVAVSVILWGWWWGWLYVQLTAVVLQFLSFREGSGGGCCKCTCDSWFVAVSVIPLWGWLWMYRQQLLCCSFCHFIRQWCGGACECTDDSCCVAVSVSSWRSWCTRTRRKPSWGVCLEPTTSCTATWSCTCPLLPSRLRSALLDVILVQRLSLSCNVVLGCCLKWPFWPYYSGIGRCWENPDTTRLKVAVTLVQQVSLNCNVILVSYLEWPFSIKFNSKTLIIPQGAILLQLLISDLTTVGLAGTEKTQTQHA